MTDDPTDITKNGVRYDFAFEHVPNNQLLKSAVALHFVFSHVFPIMQ